MKWNFKNRRNFLGECMQRIEKCIQERFLRNEEVEREKKMNQLGRLRKVKVRRVQGY